MKMKKRKRNMTCFEFKVTAREYRIRTKEWLFQLWLNLQTVTFSTNFSVRPLERIPRGADPLEHDGYHMATSVASNVMIMHRNFRNDSADYLILCHIPSGEQYFIQFPKISAVAPVVKQEPENTWGLPEPYLFVEEPVYEDAGMRN
jgi:hypothetical protein